MQRSALMNSSILDCC